VIPDAPTKRQAQVLRLINGHALATGHSPTHRWIAKALGIKNAHGVGCHLTLLRAKGLVSWARGKHATLRVTGYGQSCLLGRDGQEAPP
jgi:SOS-response transcriptional repressor LexA